MKKKFKVDKKNVIIISIFVILGILWLSYIVYLSKDSVNNLLKKTGFDILFQSSKQKEDNILFEIRHDTNNDGFKETFYFKKLDVGYNIMIVNSKNKIIFTERVDYEPLEISLIKNKKYYSYYVETTDGNYNIVFDGSNYLIK